MPIYATTSDLQTWMGSAVTLPGNAAQMLQLSSMRVSEATRLIWYATNPDGTPSDATQAAAFNQATCADAAALIEAGIDPNAGLVSIVSVESASSIGSAHITMNATDATNAAQSKELLLRGLAPYARMILRSAGLTPTAPWIVG